MNSITKAAFAVGMTIFLINFGHHAMAQTREQASGKEILDRIRQQVPDLSNEMKVAEERGRQLLELSLKDLLLLTTHRNVTIQSSKIGETAAEAQLIAVSQIDKPVFATTIQQAKTASVSSTDLADASASPYITSLDRSTTTVVSTLSKKNTLGMTYSASLQRSVSQNKVYTQSEAGGSFEGGTTTDEPLESAVLSAGVSIPLFQGWGDVNQLPIRRGEIGLESSRLSTHKTTSSLLETAAKVYWNLVGTRENIKTLEEAVKLSETLVNETRARVEIGVLNPTDLQETQTQLASNQQNLLSAKIQEQEIEDQIRSLLNIGVEPIGIKPIDLPRIHREAFDFRELLGKIYDTHPELQSLEMSLKSNTYDMEEALNADKTNLDFDITYSLSGYGKSTGEALQAFSHPSLQGYQLGLTVTVPLFNQSTDQTILKRKAEKSQIELQILDKKQQLNIDLQTILRNLKFGLEEEKTALLSVNLAKELLEKEVEKLRLGKSTSYTVSQAQKKYTDAQLSEILVRVRNEQNYISLIALTGDLFTEFGLSQE